MAMSIHLGDYIDRGPNSKGVIDLILERRESRQGVEHICLLGNHEDAMFNEFLEDPGGKRQDWLQFGGIETAQSYGVDITAATDTDIAVGLRQSISKAHEDFYKNLELYYIVDDFLFVHAGIKPEVPIEKQDKPDLIFTREPFMSYEGAHPYRVVHGHTSAPDRKVDIRHNRINVDTGHYMGGPLACVVIEGAQVEVIEVQ